MKVFRWALLLPLGGCGVIFIIIGLLAYAGVMNMLPEEALIFAITFWATGMGMLLGGIIPFWIIVHGEHQRQEVLTYGQKVRAQVCEIKEVTTVNMNRKHPWVIQARCRHPQTGEEVTLKSHMLWKLNVGVGDTVTIAFDPYKERRYAFELSEEA